jgi:putative DNA methylase
MLNANNIRLTTELKELDDHIAINASDCGLAERYGRGRTTHTVHVWWARRPHSAMELLVGEVLRKARDNGNIPVVLDIFGGGGTIPVEIARAGGQAFTIDCNPLSVFIQRSLLEWSQASFRSLGKPNTLRLLRESGKRILRQVAKVTSPLFPMRSKGQSGEYPFVYFWSYRLPCAKCGFEFRLSKRPWISKKRELQIFLESIIDNVAQQEKIRLRNTRRGAPTNNWQKRGGVVCPQCGHLHESPSIKSASDVLDVVGYVLPGRNGKVFKEPGNNALPDADLVQKTERALLKRLGVSLPAVCLPKWSGIVNPALYGMETYSEFLNPRQRVVLLHLIEQLNIEMQSVARREGQETALFIGAALSGLIDQIVDWNCRLSMWISQNEQIGRAFCGPGVSMLWDYVESDPAAHGPANLWDKLERIEAGVASLDIFAECPVVTKGWAQKLPFPNGKFDAVITDPPYYDNIFYNVLADFFFVWKRMLFGRLAPDIFKTESTTDSEELVASTFRQGTPLAAHGWYTTEMSKALQEAERVLKPHGKLALVYSHSSIGGWEAILGALRASGLFLDDVVPLNVERKARPRAMSSSAVNTCVAFIASKKKHTKKQIAVETLELFFEEKVIPLIKSLHRVGWDDGDVGIAALAECVAYLANAERVRGVSDREAIIKVATLLGPHVPEFRLQLRGSL